MAIKGPYLSSILHEWLSIEWTFLPFPGSVVEWIFHTLNANFGCFVEWVFRAEEAKKGATPSNQDSSIVFLGQSIRLPFSADPD